jgi:hypothetical protein
MPPALFALVMFKVGSHFLHKQAWTMNILFYTSHCSWNDRHMPPHSAVGWNGVSRSSCPV